MRSLQSAGTILQISQGKGQNQRVADSGRRETPREDGTGSGGTGRGEETGEASWKDRSAWRKTPNAPKRSPRRPQTPP